jgi:hypothetical protein
MKEDFKIPNKSELPPKVSTILNYNAIKWVQAFKGDCFQRIISTLVP